jgi:NAD(P)-dependent dehydrogenase (short-subunit alcohol dehydrogenase family)
MGINLDGVVFGVHAALPALKSRGGGTVIATASMAGLVAMPIEPIYGANKHAVVGLIRSLGPAYLDAGISFHALCPSFTDTAIIDDIREFLQSADFPILTTSDVVDTFLQILESPDSGQCWFVVPGRTSEPFRFRNVPGPRSPE